LSHWTARAGYSVFGWFLLPGVRYKLWADEAEAKAGAWRAAAGEAAAGAGAGAEGWARRGAKDGGAAKEQAQLREAGEQAGGARKRRRLPAPSTILRKKRHLPLEYPGTTSTSPPLSSACPATAAPPHAPWALKCLWPAGRGPRALKPATSSRHRWRVL